MHSASVTVEKQLISQIGKGVLVFAAVAPDDTVKEVDAMAEKILKYKMWPDESGANVSSLEHFIVSVTARTGCYDILPASCCSQALLIQCLKWKRNVVDISGDVLCVSQFTLLANTKKGTKPDFHGAAGGDHARDLYAHFVQKVQGTYVEDRVKDGVFQAMMDVGLVNDGPVTLSLEISPPKQG